MYVYERMENVLVISWGSIRGNEAINMEVNEVCAAEH